MKQVHVILFLAIAFLSEIPCQKIKDEDQAYEFGFTIDGQQHRHEKKDVNGIIMGEFGFITADGIYHVTVYATDENGNFKILKMRNIRISPPLDGSGLPEGSKLSKQPTKDVKRQTTAAPSSQSTTTTQPPPLTTEKGKPACASCSYITTEKPQPGQKLPALTPQKVPQYPQNNVVDRFGSTDQAKPFGGNQASGGNPQSPFGGNQAIVGGNQPSFGGNQQGVGGNKPPIGSNQPFGGSQPSLGGNQPPLGDIQPPIDGNQPSAILGSVSLNGPQEFVGPYKPSLGGGDQSLGAPPNQEYVSSFQNNPQSPNHVAQIQNRNPQIEVTNTSITVPGNDPIPITDRYPGMVDGLPEGIKESDVSDLLYKFNYTVGFHGHYEKGLKNGAKIGGYYVNYRDGSSRVVTYVADEYGYRPKVKFVRLGLDSPDTPKEATEKTFGLKSFEFVWYPLK